MKKVSSSSIPTLLENINPISNKWVIRWDVVEKISDETTSYQYQEQIFDRKPSLDEIKSLIVSYYNKKCDLEILMGLKFEGNLVWLSSENQFNYKSAFDFAFQTNGANLPTTFKFGTDESPVYRVFDTVEDLQGFIIQVMTHISTTLTKYWNIKDNIDWSVYELTG